MDFQLPFEDYEEFIDNLRKAEVTSPEDSPQASTKGKKSKTPAKPTKKKEKPGKKEPPRRISSRGAAATKKK